MAIIMAKIWSWQSRRRSPSQRADLTSLPTCESRFLLPLQRDTFCTMQPHKDSQAVSQSVGRSFGWAHWQTNFLCPRCSSRIEEVEEGEEEEGEPELLAKINCHEHWMSFKANTEKKSYEYWTTSTSTLEEDLLHSPSLSFASSFSVTR